MRVQRAQSTAKTCSRTLAYTLATSFDESKVLSHESHPLEDVARLRAELLEALRRDFISMFHRNLVPDRRGREVPRDALAAIVNGTDGDFYAVGFSAIRLGARSTVRTRNSYNLCRRKPRAAVAARKSELADCKTLASPVQARAVLRAA